MTKDYDSSWDMDECEEADDAFDKKYLEWEKRSWFPWLKSNLKFPFSIKRMEDDDDAYFLEGTKNVPFRLDHVMEAIDIAMEDEHYGIILYVKEGKIKGQVPLCDVEVTSRENENYWPVREYVVWFANR